MYYYILLSPGNKLMNAKRVNFLKLYSIESVKGTKLNLEFSSLNYKHIQNFIKSKIYSLVLNGRLD